MKRVSIIQEYVPQYRRPFFEGLIEQGASAGIQISVFAGRANSEQAARGDDAHADFVIPLEQREYKVFGRRLVLRNVTRVLRGADLVILEQARRNLDAYFLLLSPFSPRNRVALWGHGRDYTKPASWLDRLLQRTLTLRSGWFFAYTRQGLEYLVSIGMDPSTITEVKNTIDVNSLVLDMEQAAKHEFREISQNYDLRGKTAVYIGGLDRSKRIPFLLEASKLAHDRDNEFRLLLAGKGSQEQEVLRFCSENATWASYIGMVSGRAKAGLMAAADILAVPGRVGLVAVDSFAAGRPIVTTAWPWHAPEFDYLVPDKTVLVSEDTTDGYASTMLDILADKKRLLDMQMACRGEVPEFEIAGMVDRFLTGVQAALVRAGIKEK